MVRRGRGRRRRGSFGFLYKVLSAAAIVLAIVGACIIFFRVDHIEVVGASVYTDGQIIAASGVERGDNLFLIREISAGRKVLKQLPYVREINLTPALPDRLTITVTESTRAAVITDSDGEKWIIDAHGKLLEPCGDEGAEGCPLVIGITPILPRAGETVQAGVEQSGRLDTLRQLLSALEGRGVLEKVEYINLTGVSRVRMGYEQRLVVELPLYAQDFPQRINLLRAAAEYLDGGQTGVLDLTGEQGRFIPGGQ